MSRPKFYLQKKPVNGVEQPKIDIELTYPGLYVLEVKGISNKGKIKNITFENYAEVTEPRIDIPSSLSRETTKVEIKVAFLGANRRDTYDDFSDFISGSVVEYSDSIRSRKTDLLNIESVEPDYDSLIGNAQSIQVVYKFENLKGNSIKI